MESSEKTSWLNRFSHFQYLTVIWLILLTLVMSFLIITLLQARVMVKTTLTQAADDLAELANERIEYTVHLSQTVPFSTHFAINEEILVPVNLTVEHTITVDNEIPFQQMLDVPVNLEIDEVLPVDTTVPFNDKISVPIDQEISIDEVFAVQLDIPLFGVTTVDVPIRSQIPVKFDVEVPINRNIPIKTNIPVKFPISKTLTVAVDRRVPVKIDIPINIPISTEVTVPISRTIPVELNVPIVMEVPLDIAISETPFGDYLRNASKQLDKAVTN
jgi:hypothetical protein